MKHTAIAVILVCLSFAVSSEEKGGTTRLQAAKTFVSEAAAKNPEGVSAAFLPLELALKMMGGSGAAVTDEQKAQMKAEYETERNRQVESCIAKLGGQDPAKLEFKDLGQSHYSPEELAEIKSMEMGSDHGDVAVKTSTTTYYFRMFQYKDKWYFVDFH